MHVYFTLYFTLLWAICWDIIIQPTFMSVGGNAGSFIVAFNRPSWNQYNAHDPHRLQKQGVIVGH